MAETGMIGSATSNAAELELQTQPMEETYGRSRLDDMVEFFRLRGRTIATAAALSLAAACSGGDSRANISPSSAESAAAANEAGTCTDPNMGANRADSVFADRSSFLPSLAEKSEGINKLLEKETVVGILQEQTSNDSRVAAIFSELYRLRDGQEAPNTLTVPGVEEAMNTLESNDEFALKRIADICTEFNFVEARENFAVIGGNATEILVERNEQGHVSRVLFIPVDVDRVVRGYVLGANFDNADLKNADFLRQFMNDVIVTENGTVIVRNLALSGGFDIDVAEQEQPVSPAEEEAEQKADGSGGGTAKRGGGGQKGGTGGPGGDSGSGGQPGGGGPGCTGVGPGCPGEGPGPGGPGGPSKEQEQPAPTTTTTRPAPTTTTTTQPKPTSTTTTTQPQKSDPGTTTTTIPCDDTRYRC